MTERKWQVQHFLQVRWLFVIKDKKVFGLCIDQLEETRRPTVYGNRIALGVFVRIALGVFSGIALGVFLVTDEDHELWKFNSFMTEVPIV